MVLDYHFFGINFKNENSTFSSLSRCTEKKTQIPLLGLQVAWLLHLHGLLTLHSVPLTLTSGRLFGGLIPQMAHSPTSMKLWAQLPPHPRGLPDLPEHTGLLTHSPWLCFLTSRSLPGQLTHVPVTSSPVYLSPAHACTCLSPDPSTGVRAGEVLPCPPQAASHTHRCLAPVKGST